MSTQAYIVDTYTIFAASGLAATTIMRSVMAGVLPLAAPKMYAALGIGWWWVCRTQAASTTANVPIEYICQILGRFVHAHAAQSTTAYP